MKLLKCQLCEVVNEKVTERYTDKEYLIPVNMCDPCFHETENDELQMQIEQSEDY